VLHVIDSSEFVSSGGILVLTSDCLYVDPTYHDITAYETTSSVNATEQKSEKYFNNSKKGTSRYVNDIDR
jgi:hypothetical protein